MPERAEAVHAVSASPWPGRRPGTVGTASLGMIAALSLGLGAARPAGAAPAEARVALGGATTTSAPDPSPASERPNDGPGLPAGSVREQLDRDPTVVPFGKGAIFVPSVRSALDEPPVVVRYEGKRVAEDTTGRRIPLLPGTYDVHFGSGSRLQRLHRRVTVKEGQTAVIPVYWAGLTVHVVDERYGTLRGSYELIRVADREYFGSGFGTDEQAGEPISTWILEPGLYKIVRVGDTYRARRDFVTVRLVSGKHTHFILVTDEASGSFLGGGEVPKDEVFGTRQGFVGSLILGGDLSMNVRRNALGLGDGVNYSVRAFLDGRFSVDIAGDPLVLQLQVEQGQTKAPELPFQKTQDRADIDALYVYRLTRWIGPYLRIGAETNLLPGYQFFEEGQAVAIRDAAGERQDGAGPEQVDPEGLEVALRSDRLRLSPSFGLSTVKEGIGFNVRLVKTLFAEASVRSGLGARHRVARDLYELTGSPDAAVLSYQRVASRHQTGVEVTGLVVARITRWVLASFEVDSLLPFEGLSEIVLEAEGGVNVKLTSYLSLNYVMRFIRDRAISEEDRLAQDVLLRFSVELL